MTTDILSALTAEELAAQIEEIEGEMHRHGHDITVLRGRKIILEAYLMKALGDGEAVVAPSGRVVYKDEGPLGSATINEAALFEHGHRMAEDLRPRPSWKFIGVGAIRKAAKEGRLPEGTTAATFLIPAPRGSKLRWRTVGEDSDD